MKNCIISKGFRADPVSKKGFHLVDEGNGGKYLFIEFENIDNVINILFDVKKTNEERRRIK